MKRLCGILLACMLLMGCQMQTKDETLNKIHTAQEKINSFDVLSELMITNHQNKKDEVFRVIESGTFEVSPLQGVFTINIEQPYNGNSLSVDSSHHTYYFLEDRIFEKHPMNDTWKSINHDFPAKNLMENYSLLFNQIAKQSEQESTITEKENDLIFETSIDKDFIKQVITQLTFSNKETERTQIESLLSSIQSQKGTLIAVYDRTNYFPKNFTISLPLSDADSQDVRPALSLNIIFSNVNKTEKIAPPEPIQ